MGKRMPMGVGFGIGVLWLLMAATCFWAMARGLTHHRGDWALAWGVIGALLAAAGVAAMVGTWYHQNRILGRHHH